MAKRKVDDYSRNTKLIGQRREFRLRIEREQGSTRYWEG